MPRSRSCAVATLRSSALLSTSSALAKWMSRSIMRGNLRVPAASARGGRESPQISACPDRDLNRAAAGRAVPPPSTAAGFLLEEVLDPVGPALRTGRMAVAALLEGL